MIPKIEVYLKIIETRAKSIMMMYPGIEISTYGMYNIERKWGSIEPLNPRMPDSFLDGIQTVFRYRNDVHDVALASYLPSHLTDLQGWRDTHSFAYILFADERQHKQFCEDFMWDVLVEVFGIKPLHAMESLGDTIDHVSETLNRPFVPVEYFHRTMRR